MKYTALLMVISAVVIACFAGVHSATGPDRAENPLLLGLVLPLVFAVALASAGVAMWFLGGRGYTASEPTSGPFAPTDPTKRSG
jgi:hypothetical protein